MKTSRWFVLLGLLVIFGLQNIGCDRMPSPTAPSEIPLQANEENFVATKHKAPTFNLDVLQEYDIVKSWTSSILISYTKGGWVGKKSLAVLYVRPESMSTGEDTEITSQVSLTSDNQLLFNFQPEDLAFNSSAKLILNFKKLVDKNDGEDCDLVLSGLNPATGEFEFLATSSSNDNDFKWEKSKWRVSFDIDHFSIYLVSKD